jgi:hypothetical protein
VKAELVALISTAKVSTSISEARVLLAKLVYVYTLVAEGRVINPWDPLRPFTIEQELHGVNHEKRSLRPL